MKVERWSSWASVNSVLCWLESKVQVLAYNWWCALLQRPPRAGRAAMLAEQSVVGVQVHGGVSG
jgi:hypothetical protein